MARRKWIDKKAATHFTLVHRPQNDPKIHDETAPAMVLNPTELPNAGKSKAKNLEDLASDIGSEADGMRANEGEAATYGVYFDDTEYDYMQHLRDLGTGDGTAVFIEATDPNSEAKGKHKQSLADAIKEMDINDKAEKLVGKDMLPSTDLQRATYQNQQDVPDAIAGFQPDMDPELREVLKALDDDAYVDETGDDDVFQELAKDGKEIDMDEFEGIYDDDDDGWESDVTERPVQKIKDARLDVDEEAEAEDKVPQLVSELPPASEDHDWMEEYQQFKNDQAQPRKPAQQGRISEAEFKSRGNNADGVRRKKRKGALTTPSGFSMSSGTLPRTEVQRILDARFEKVAKEYTLDLDGEYDDDDIDLKSESVYSRQTASTAQGAMPLDFMQNVDDFLENSRRVGRRGRVKLGRHQEGLAQLDEIRNGLGRARLSKKK